MFYTFFVLFDQTTFLGFSSLITIASSVFAGWENPTHYVSEHNTCPWGNCSHAGTRECYSVLVYPNIYVLGFVPGVPDAVGVPAGVVPAAGVSAAAVSWEQFSTGQWEPAWPDVSAVPGEVGRERTYTCAGCGKYRSLHSYTDACHHCICQVPSPDADVP